MSSQFYYFASLGFVCGTNNPSFPECRDREAACPEWSRSGLCRTHFSYMSENCPVSCSLCRCAIFSLLRKVITISFNSQLRWCMVDFQLKNVQLIFFWILPKYLLQGCCCGTMPSVSPPRSCSRTSRAGAPRHLRPDHLHRGAQVLPAPVLHQVPGVGQVRERGELQQGLLWQTLHSARETGPPGRANHEQSLGNCHLRPGLQLQPPQYSALLPAWHPGPGRPGGVLSGANIRLSAAGPSVRGSAAPGRDPR